MTVQSPDWDRVVTSLLNEFGDSIDDAPDFVSTTVAAEVERLDDSAVRSYLEILVSRAARRRLHAVNRPVVAPLALPRRRGGFPSGADRVGERCLRSRLFPRS